MVQFPKDLVHDTFLLINNSTSYKIESAQGLK